ncbi:MAG: FHA domain-containing protein [Burkholderiaceae bacterium]
MGAVAVLETVDRDGQARDTLVVRRWPLRVGRALDNHMVLSDPFVAAHHFQVQADDEGLQLTVDDTGNGVQIGRKRVHSGETHRWALEAEPLELTVGRTRLRLRSAAQPVPAELPLAGLATRSRRWVPSLVAASVLLATLMFVSYLDSDPDALGRASAGVLLGAVSVTGLWCGLWALLSKTFTRQARFGWHLRVFLFAGIAWLAADHLPGLLAFALSWSWISNFDFIATYGVVAAALYYHLLAVELSRPRLMRAAAVAGTAVAVALTLWFNVQRNDRFGEDLYMGHLYVPALRLAHPASVDRYLEGVAALQSSLDDKARIAARGDFLEGSVED